MATLAVSFAGAALGSWLAPVGFTFLGLTGGQLGWLGGSIVGNWLFGNKSSAQQQVSPTMDLKVMSIGYGHPIPYFEAHPRIAGQLWWNSDRRVIEETVDSGGGKGMGGDAPSQTIRTYDMDGIFGLGERQILTVTRIWQNGELVYGFLTPQTSADLAGEENNAGWLAKALKSVSASLSTERWERLTIYTGSPDQLPDPTYEAAVGSENAIGYRHRSYVFIQGLHLGQSGMIPNFTFEVQTKPIHDDLTIEHFYTLPDDHHWAPNGVPVATTSLGKKMWFGIEPYSDNPFHTDLTERIGLFNHETLQFEFLLDIPEKPTSFISDIGVTWEDRVWTVWDNLNDLVASGTCIVYNTDGTSFDTGNPPSYLNSSGTLGCTAIVEGRRTNPLYPDLDPNPEVDLSTGVTVFLIRERNGFGPAVFWSDLSLPGGGWAGNLLSSGSKPNLGFNNAFFHGANRILDRVYLTTLTTDGDARGLVWVDVGSKAITYIKTFTANYAPAALVGWDERLYVAADQTRPNVVQKLDKDGVLIAEVDVGFAPVKLIDDKFGNLYVQSGGLTPLVKRVFKSGMTLDKQVSLIDQNDTIFGANQYYGVGIFVRRSASGDMEDIRLLAGPGTLNDETLRDVVERLCLRSGLTADQFDVEPLTAITKPVRGFVISQVSSVRAALELLMSTYFFDMVVDSKIRFVPRGGAVAATIPYTDLGVVKDGDKFPEPLELKINNDLEVPLQIAVTAANVLDDYNDDTQKSERVNLESNTIQAIKLPLVFMPFEIKQLSDALIWDLVASKVTTTLQVFGHYARLQPTDPVYAIDKAGSQFRFRLGRIIDTYPALGYDAVLDDPTIFLSEGITSAAYGSSGTLVIPPVDTLMMLADTPIQRDFDDAAGLYVSTMGADTPYPGSIIYQSRDGGLSFAQVAAVTESGVFGTCTTILGDWTKGQHVIDWTNTVTVDVGLNSTLSSSTRSAVYNNRFVNRMLIGNEVIQFIYATLLSPGVYKLSGLLRGLTGTEWASVGHVASEKCMRLRDTGGVRRIEVQNSDVGRELIYLGVTIGRRRSSAANVPFTVAGVGMKPYAPIDIRGARDAGDLTVSWQRRSRLSARLIGALGMSCPLGEDIEQYKVRVYDDDTFTTVVRGPVTVSSPSFAYTLLEQIEDFGGSQPQHPVYIGVTQVSAVAGEGYEARDAI